MEESFRKTIGDHYALAFPDLKVKYIFQELTDLPSSVKAPEGRTKPWGTGHALLAARHLLRSPFAVINADDYYGSSGYDLLAAFLRKTQPSHYAMVSYQLKNSLSAFGAVSRGVIENTAGGFLKKITEHTKLQREENGMIASRGEEGVLFFTGEELVSLNFWALLPDFFPLLERLFEEFLTDAFEKHREDSLEFYLPYALNRCVAEGEISVSIIPTEDPWFGLTYPSDLLQVKTGLQSRIDEGHYPASLLKKSI
jgi:NDP-sugar pyrophosphorylase family protein